jgi:hypothetical protein
MTGGRFFGTTGRGLTVAAAILAAVGLTTVPRPADAGGWGGGGISPGAAAARAELLEPRLWILLRLLGSQRPRKL